MQKLLRVKVSLVDILVFPSIVVVDVITILCAAKRTVSLLGMSTLLLIVHYTTDAVSLVQEIKGLINLGKWQLVCDVVV